MFVEGFDSGFFLSLSRQMPDSSSQIRVLGLMLLLLSPARKIPNSRSQLQILDSTCSSCSPDRILEPGAASTVANHLS